VGYVISVDNAEKRIFHRVLMSICETSEELKMSGRTHRYPEPTVGALILNRRGQVLLAKSIKWLDRFTLPGGHIELGETVEEALKREIREEVGLEIEIIRFLQFQEAIYSPEFIHRKHFIFLDFLCKAKTDRVQVDNKEIQDFRWVDPQKALEMNVEPFSKKTIAKYLETRNKN
jgi:nucleoside triphosphatase